MAGDDIVRQVIPPFAIIRKILGEQEAGGKVPYRLAVHCMRIEQPEGILLYQTLTGELLFLPHPEAALLAQLPGPVPVELAGLASGRFVVPVGTDDMALADQARKIAALFRKEETALTRYTIFTTTDCNARCFYCYEASWQRSTMTEQTARDTARYITAHCGGRPVHIKWFGGEPLVNVRAIDTISRCLRQQGVVYSAVMTSNGYLFEEAMVQRAQAEWNLQDVQITLDGTEEVYNRRKAYVAARGSPFRRVLHNIGLLLDAGIGVNVRLNVDENNEPDLYALVDLLAERFGKRPGFGIHVLDIREHSRETGLPCQSEQKVRSYAAMLCALRSYIESKGVAAHVALERGPTVNACKADSSNNTTVNTDGRLGRCDGCKDGGIWGSIYSDAVDEDMLRSWKERKPPEDACRTCVVYPQCLRLKKCPVPEHCSALNRLYREDRLRRAVLDAYKDWKAAGQG